MMMKKIILIIHLPDEVLGALNDEKNKTFKEKHEKEFFKICKKFMIEGLNSLERFSTVEAQRKARSDALGWKPQKDIAVEYVNRNKDEFTKKEQKKIKKGLLNYFINNLKKRSSTVSYFNRYKEQFSQEEQNQIKKELFPYFIHDLKKRSDTVSYFNRYKEQFSQEEQKQIKKELGIE